MPKALSIVFFNLRSCKISKILTKLLTNLCKLCYHILYTLATLTKKVIKMEIKIVENQNPKIHIEESKLGFGQYFTDHMFVMDYEQGKGWYDARIIPFGNISLHPASTVLHYGAEIFEGLKAYRTASGEIQLFRPMEKHNCPLCPAGK